VNPEIIENKAFMPKLGFSKKIKVKENKHNLRGESTKKAKLMFRWLRYNCSYLKNEMSEQMFL